MTTHPLRFKRVPLMLATALVSSGLLLAGCSNDDTVAGDTEVAEPAVTETDNAAAGTDAGDDESALADDVSKAVDPNATTVNDTQADEAVAPEPQVVDKTISPIAAAVKERSLVTNPTKKGTPEDTVKLALDTLYYGDVDKAATYYQVDMQNFAEELKNTQFAFKQTVERVTITDTQYNADKSRATVIGELKLKDQDAPAPLTYELKKVDGTWKILG